MKLLTKEEEKIVEVVERRCSKELGKFGKCGDTLRERILSLSVQAAKKELDFFPDGFRASFTHASRQAKKESQRLEKCKQFGLGQYLQKRANELRAHADFLHKCVQRYGRNDHDEAVPVLVMNVLELNPDFKDWEALLRVMAEAYVTVGRNSEHLYADKFLRAAKPYRLRRAKEKVRAAAK